MFEQGPPSMVSYAGSIDSVEPKTPGKKNLEFQENFKEQNYSKQDSGFDSVDSSVGFEAEILTEVSNESASLSLPLKSITVKSSICGNIVHNETQFVYKNCDSSAIQIVMFLVKQIKKSNEKIDIFKFGVANFIELLDFLHDPSFVTRTIVTTLQCITLVPNFRPAEPE